MNQNSEQGTQTDDSVEDDNRPSDSLPFWRVMLSVFQAAFGVQNERNKERDFSQGRLLPFIIAALLFTAVFVGGLIMIVKLVLGADA